MKESDIFWFIPFAILLYQEISHLKQYRTFRREGMLKSAQIIFIAQPFRSPPIYKLKIKDGGYPYSKHQLKTTFISRLYPKLLKKDLDVFLMEEHLYCILAHPAYILLNFMLVALVGITTVCLIIYSK